VCVCVFVCGCVCVCVCESERERERERERESVCVCACMHLLVCVCIYVCVYAHVHYACVWLYYVCVKRRTHERMMSRLIRVSMIMFRQCCCHKHAPMQKDERRNVVTFVHGGFESQAARTRLKK